MDNDIENIERCEEDAYLLTRVFGVAHEARLAHLLTLEPLRFIIGLHILFVDFESGGGICV